MDDNNKVLEDAQNAKEIQFQMSDLFTELAILQNYESTLLCMVERMTTTNDGKKPTLNLPNDVTSKLVIEYDLWITLLRAAIYFASEGQTITNRLDELNKASINE